MALWFPGGPHPECLCRSCYWKCLAQREAFDFEASTREGVWEEGVRGGEGTRKKGRANIGRGKIGEKERWGGEDKKRLERLWGKRGE